MASATKPPSLPAFPFRLSPDREKVHPFSPIGPSIDALRQGSAGSPRVRRRHPPARFAPDPHRVAHRDHKSSSPFGRLRGNRQVENRDLAGLPGLVRAAVRSVLLLWESPPEKYCGSKCSHTGPLPPNGRLANRTHKWSRPEPPPPLARRRPQRTTLLRRPPKCPSRRCGICRPQDACPGSPARGWHSTLRFPPACIPGRASSTYSNHGYRGGFPAPRIQACQGSDSSSRWRQTMQRGSGNSILRLTDLAHDRTNIEWSDRGQVRGAANRNSL